MPSSLKVFEVHDLVQGIGRDEGCFPDFAFGARNQEILETIDQSSRSGTWVSVPGSVGVLVMRNA